MAILRAPVGRIRDISIQIKQLEDRLMSANIIPMKEQSQIHATLAQLRKELEELEIRTRQR